MSEPRLVVDADRCIGSELCVASFPLALAFDDADQLAVVLDGAGELKQEELVELVFICPMGAIRLGTAA